MSYPVPPPSGPPPSMGPGARPVERGQADPGTIIREVQEIRSHYNVHVDSNNVTVGYQLQGVPRTYKLAFDAIPLGGISKSLLYGGAGRTRVSGTFLIDAIRGAENMAGRPVTQREAEAFAYHSSKRIMYSFFGTGFAFITGYTLAYQGRQKMKFPFMAPKPLERYDNFPNRFLPVLKGNYSRIMWHITRGNIYAGIGLLLANPLFSSMGDSAMMVGLYRDERTKDVVKSMKGTFDRINSNRVRPGQEKPLPQGKPEGQQEGPDPQGYYNDSPVPNDYSGGREYGGDNAYTDGTTDTGMLDDSTMRQRESRQSSPTSFGSNARRQQQSIPVQQPDDLDRSSSSDFLFNDDASPKAGNGPNMSPPQSHRATGSVWERLRHGGPAPTRDEPQDRRSVTPPSPSPQQQASPTGWPGRKDNESKADSFSFSNSDEDRVLAKQQAQKEFDEMLDRERKDSGSEEYDRGMRATEVGAESPNAVSGGSAWGRRRGL